MGKLTAHQIARASKRGLLNDGDGLYLQISAAGAKSWIFRYRAEGKLRDHGLGSASTLSLAEAREKARACRQMRLEGIDPIEAKKRRRVAARLEAARSITFAECAERYVEAHKAAWKNPKHGAQWSATLSAYAYPVFGALPVADIDVGLVLKALEPIWTEKPETASRVRGRIEAVLDWAKVREYREGANPALWKGNLSHMLPARAKLRKVEHHPALPYKDMPAFWQALAEQPGVGAEALRFTILTAARSGEVRGATWAEIDLDAGLWTIPEDRMKAAREHRVPLSPQAVAVLKEAAKRGTEGLIFPGAKSGKMLSDMSLTAVLRRMKRDDITVHGFRSTFRDWAADCTQAPRELAEAALAHTQGSKAEQAYWRSDMAEKRRPLMAQWGAFCGGRFWHD